MELALKFAEKGKGNVSPNPLVGALIVKRGRIVGRGWHRKCGEPHAEVCALKEAGKKAGQKHLEAQRADFIKRNEKTLKDIGKKAQDSGIY